MDVTPEGYGMLLRIEYGGWRHAKRQYESGKWNRETAAARMDAQRGHILHWKQKCKDVLNPEDYPEEYYLDTPEPAEKIFPEEDTPKLEEKLMVVNKIEVPEGNGTQMNILDYMQDGNISWR